MKILTKVLERMNAINEARSPGWKDWTLRELKEMLKMAENEVPSRTVWTGGFGFKKTPGGFTVSFEGYFRIKTRGLKP